MRGFITELRRRHVDRAAIAYLAASWLIVQILETTLPLYDVDESVIRWIVLALVVGFVPALALSWAFEWSPRGLRTQATIDQESKTEPAAPSSRTADRVIIGVLALAVLFFAADRFLTLEPTETRSIAVLPFEDLTETQDQAYFADGLAEELLNLLAQNTSLRVAARTSSFRFRDADMTISEIAAQLGVEHVLEGSVRRDGDRIRVTAQLIEAASGFHLWSQTYDETFSDIFSVQDRMSAQIANALQATVLREPMRARPTDPRAYALFLQAKYLASRGSERDLREATDLYQQALAIDSRYAPAWSELASAYINRASNGFVPYDEGYERGREAALRSVTIDPNHAHGYNQLAWVAFWYQADIETAVEYARKALEVAPNAPDDLGVVSVLLQALGQTDDAIALHEYSVRRSPVDATAAYNMALSYKYAGRLDDAERAFRRVIQLSPNYAGAGYHLGETLLLTGRAEEALEVWATDTDDDYRTKGMALGASALGDRSRADMALQELIDGWGTQWPSEVAHVYAWRGELDEAFEWLERDLDVSGAGGWGEWKLQPLYANLRDDPRWQEFLERVGASDAQLARYQLEVEIPAR
jgi:adenylate cyclase